MGQNDSTFWAISIHALREEGDKLPPFVQRPIVQFQSTPSARRATFLDEFDHIIKEFQSTPSARRATRKVRAKSIDNIFQSTPSARRATFRARRAVS